MSELRPDKPKMERADSRPSSDVLPMSSVPGAAGEQDTKRLRYPGRYGAVFDNQPVKAL